MAALSLCLFLNPQLYARMRKLFLIEGKQSAFHQLPTRIPAGHGKVKFKERWPIFLPIE
jgi:hypothetical protein